MPPLLLELAQRHAVLLEEADEVLAGDAAVLAAGDAVAAEPAGIEPLAHRPGATLQIFATWPVVKTFFMAGTPKYALLLSPLPIGLCG